MKQKYDPHIRVRFDLFDDPQFRTIPNKHKAHCLCVLICLLKFVNNKTLQCYPRKATISSMTGLSYTTIYRATIWLIRAKITSLFHQKPRFYLAIVVLNSKVSFFSCKINQNLNFDQKESSL